MIYQDPFDVDELLAQSACRQVVMRAADLIDRNDYKNFADLFTDEAELTRPGGDPLRGREAILNSYQSRSGARITKHMILGTIFSDYASASLTARSQVLLWSGNADDAPGPFGRPAKGRQVTGEFQDEMVQTRMGWRIHRRTARFDFFCDITD